jgi:hypothetical protein
MEASSSRMPAEKTGTSGKPAVARCQQRQQEHQKASRDNRNIREVSIKVPAETIGTSGKQQKQDASREDSNIMEASSSKIQQ